MGRKRREKSPKQKRDKEKRKRTATSSVPPPAELLVAAGLGDITCVRALVHAGADIHWVDGELSTPLHAASRAGSYEVVEYLLKRGASVVAEDLRGDTACHIAARHHHLNILTKLLRAGPPGLIDQRNDKGETVQVLTSAAIECQEAQRHLRVGFQAVKKRRTQHHHAREACEGSPSKSFIDDPSDDDCLDPEEKWRRRLQREMSPPLFDGVFEAYPDDDWQGDAFETAEEYAQRIWQEMESKKKNRIRGADDENQDKQKQDAVDGESREKHSFQEEQQQAADTAWRAALAAGAPGPKHASYTARWEFFCSKNVDSNLNLGRIRYDDVPWVLPEVEQPTKDQLGKVLFHSIQEADTRRKVLRRELVRWHPDKFVAKFGRRLEEDDRERILQRVTKMIQTLTALHAEVGQSW